MYRVYKESVTSHKMSIFKYNVINLEKLVLMIGIFSFRYSELGNLDIVT